PDMDSRARRRLLSGILIDSNIGSYLSVFWEGRSLSRVPGNMRYATLFKYLYRFPLQEELVTFLKKYDSPPCSNVAKIGEIKGAYHYLTGDLEKAKSCLSSSNSTNANLLRSIIEVDSNDTPSIDAHLERINDKNRQFAESSVLLYAGSYQRALELAEGMWREKDRLPLLKNPHVLSLLIGKIIAALLLLRLPSKALTWLETNLEELDSIFNTSIWEAICRRYLATGDHGLHCFERIEEWQQAHLQRGLTLRSLGRLEESLDAFEKENRCFPSWQNTLQIALTLRCLGKISESNDTLSTLPDYIWLFDGNKKIKKSDKQFCDTFSKLYDIERNRTPNISIDNSVWETLLRSHLPFFQSLVFDDEPFFWMRFS
ncbi:MAG: hypothetical protein MI756_13105, partial [Chromatiales bacterium]|nr:hypothetical protein [Chromatiales bacterium]